MIVQKIFHLRKPIVEAREQLRKAGTYNDAGIACADSLATIEFNLPNGQPVVSEIEEIPADEPYNILFRSVNGAVHLAGMIELFPIRPNLTEAVLTIEYAAASPVQKAIEAISTGFDRFLNRQLARIEQGTDLAHAA